MNRITAQGLVLEVARQQPDRMAIVTDLHPRHVCTVFTDLRETFPIITEIRAHSTMPTILIQLNPGHQTRLYVFSEHAARTGVIRGLSLDLTYIDYDIDIGSDFYRELAARSREVIRA